MPEFQEIVGELDESQVADAESALGVTLPQAYRRFLLSTGGGSLARNYVIPEFDGSAIFSEFHDVGELVRAQGVGSNEVVPHEYIVVGDGGGGGLCVKVAGDDVGSVWWVDYDGAEIIGAEEPTQDVMIRQADDFDAFLSMIG